MIFFESLYIRCHLKPNVFPLALDLFASFLSLRSRPRSDSNVLVHFFMLSLVLALECVPVDGDIYLLSDRLKVFITL